MFIFPAFCAVDDRLFVFGGDAGGAVFLNDVHVLDLGKGKGNRIF